MTTHEIRARYLAYFKERGHAVIPSAPLVPENDPTTLFTGSGMQPLVPYLAGKEHPLGSRLADSQKSFRAMDIEEVGDNRHTTFFEMLGNWSLGDYFKKEQLPWFFGFLTDEVGLNPERLYVTVFIGDEKNDVPRDTEAVSIWKGIFAEKGIDAKDVLIGSEAEGYVKGMQGGRIFYYDAKKNWWSRAGVPENMPVGEIGGPDSEVFYDFGTPHDPRWGSECHPNCDCGRFLEIGNSVFMQYIKNADGTFGLLPKRNVDFGGGLERIAAAMHGNPDVFRIDLFEEVIALLERFSDKRYEDLRYQRSFRIIADHMRAATFMLGDGVRPGNTDRGYVLRRLIRRAIQHTHALGVAQSSQDDSMLVRSASLYIEEYKQSYPELSSEEAWQTITSEIWKEEAQFWRTLDHGLKELEKLLKDASRITGEMAYTLFTTYGFPLEMTQEIAATRSIDVDVSDFKERMKAHQDLSRAGAEQKFKGGLADHSEKTTRLHTAHHLLLKALQEVLGPHVKQRGSNITQERLRIDFSYGTKMTPDELRAVEKIVNEKIRAHLPVLRTIMPKEKAESLGAEHEFNAKYPDMVSVYAIGAPDPDHLEQAFSIEFCGGPHVDNTAVLGTFTIQKEEAVAAGIRRIKAVLKAVSD
jgi:alanyl-tRNA synthetase